MRHTKAKAKRQMQRPTKAELLQRCGDKHWSILTQNTLISESEVNKCIVRLESAVAKLTNGVATAGSSVVSLAGLDKAYTIAQMKAFKTGARPATVMHQLSKGYSDAQIEVLATYFAAQKK